ACNSGALNFLGTDNGITMARVAVAMANQASRDTGRRVKAQKAKARQDEKPNGGPRPFGWKATPVLDKNGQPVLTRKGKPKMNVLNEPDPREAALLRRAVDDLLSGVSLNEVARRWNTAGVLQPQTGRAAWEADGIRQLVANPRHAALVDRDRWERLQGVLFHRGAHCRVPRRRTLLTGLLTCGHCGAIMSRSSARGRSGRESAERKVWRCPSGKVNIDAHGLEQLLTEATLKLADGRRFAAIVRQQSDQGQDASKLVDRLEAVD